MRPENTAVNQQRHTSRAIDIEHWIATVSNHPQRVMSSSSPLEIASSDGEDNVAPRRGMSFY